MRSNYTFALIKHSFELYFGILQGGFIVFFEYYGVGQILRGDGPRVPVHGIPPPRRKTRL